jgi:hypothetical protein
MLAKAEKQLTRDVAYVTLFYSGADRSLTKIMTDLRREHTCESLSCQSAPFFGAHFNWEFSTVSFLISI